MAATAEIQCLRSTEQAAAMLDPMRLRLLEALEKPDSATGLARRLNLPRQKVNYHLRELERHGLVKVVRRRRRGSCTERIVRATARSFLISPEVLGALGGDHATVQDRFSSSYLVAMAANVIRDVAVLRHRADQARKKLATFSIFTRVKFASPEAQEGFLTDLTNAVATITEKYAAKENQPARAFELAIGSYPAITKTEEEAQAETQSMREPEETP